MILVGGLAPRLITLVTADIERGLFNRSAGCNLLSEALLKEYGAGRLRLTLVQS
jgi:hypothetical protein